MLEFNNKNISKQFCFGSTKIYRIDRTMYEVETIPSDTRCSLNNFLLRGVFPLNYYFPIRVICQFYSVSKSKLCDFITHASGIGKLSILIKNLNVEHCDIRIRIHIYVFFADFFHNSGQRRRTEEKVQQLNKMKIV